MWDFLVVALACIGFHGYSGATSQAKSGLRERNLSMSTGWERSLIDFAQA